MLTFDSCLSWVAEVPSCANSQRQSNRPVVRKYELLHDGELYSFMFLKELRQRHRPCCCRQRFGCARLWQPFVLVCCSSRVVPTVSTVKRPEYPQEGVGELTVSPVKRSVIIIIIMIIIVVVVDYYCCCCFSSSTHYYYYMLMFFRLDPRHQATIQSPVI